MKRILVESRVSVLRGNASEVLSLLSEDVRTKGVDSSMSISEEVIPDIKDFAKRMGLVVGISGMRDLITDGDTVYRCDNGHPLMTKVTGLGCGLSSVVGAFCGVAGGDNLGATAAAFGYYGLCGELAASDSPMPGSFAVHFIDRLASSGCEEIENGLNISRED